MRLHKGLHKLHKCVSELSCDREVGVRASACLSYAMVRSIPVEGTTIRVTGAIRVRDAVKVRVTVGVHSTPKHDFCVTMWFRSATPRN